MGRFACFFTTASAVWGAACLQYMHSVQEMSHGVLQLRPCMWLYFVQNAFHHMRNSP